MGLHLSEVKVVQIFYQCKIINFLKDAPTKIKANRIFVMSLTGTVVWVGGGVSAVI